MKKNFKITLAFLISFMIIFSNYVFADTISSSNATMKLVEDNVCDISFGTYGQFEKKMVNIDTEKKTIDLSLIVTNKDDGNHTHQETNSELVAGDVILLLDNSQSMSNNTVTVNGQEITRKQLIINSANTLVTKLFKANPKINIGVVEFATSTDTSKEGTDDDAQLVLSIGLSKDPDSVENSVKDALNTVAATTMGPRTDIQVGLETAQKILDTSAETDNKYIILLTDAIPNTARGVTFDTYSTATSTPTKETLTAIKNDGINVISMLVSMSTEKIAVSKEDPQPTYREVAERVFGTEDKPTAGTLYYVEDEDVEDTVTNKIYKNLVKTETKTIDDSSKYALTDIVIKDYFPENIINNFDFAYLTKPEKGTVSAEVDKSDNSITWTISELKAGETATFNYRLTLKDNIDSNIIAINLPTNKDVTIDYKENDKQQDTKHNDKCPIVILDVPSPTPIPKTGSNIKTIISSFVILGFSIAVISFIGYKRVNDK